ncbi:MAG: flavodoxin [Spirochaetaceae bacterium]|nr:MAG: flavodoxin [Spirochaetaceae bacterium]
MAKSRKIGIIVYSGTGNTYLVAEKLKEKLDNMGNATSLERLVVTGGYNPNTQSGPVRFENTPDLSGFDAVVFAGPVQAFSLSPVMSSYLSRVTGLKGKTTALLTTEAFPYSWLGGAQAIAKMKKLCLGKGAHVTGFGIVNWMRKDRLQRMATTVEKLAAAIG